MGRIANWELLKEVDFRENVQTTKRCTAKDLHDGERNVQNSWRMERFFFTVNKCTYTKM